MKSISAILLLLSFYTLKAQVTASFTPSVTEGCGSIPIVSFTNTSTGSNLSYLWDFGNGNTSVLQNPSAGFMTVGNFIVVLTVTDGVETDSASTIITVYSNPTSDFVAPVTCGSIPPGIINWATMTYTGSSQSGATFLWNLSGNPEPSNTFTTPGPWSVYYNDVAVPTYYNITLTVTNPNGCTFTNIDSILVSPSTDQNCCIMPNANAGPDQTVCGNTVQMNATAPGVNETGYWSMPSGTMFAPNQIFPTAYIVVPPFTSIQTYEFWWHILNGTCHDSDNVVITFFPAPTGLVNAGCDQLVCGLSYELVGVLQDTLGSVIWSTNNSYITIAEPDSLTTMVSLDPNSIFFVDSAFEHVSFFCSFIDSNCVSSDEVIITFQQLLQIQGTVSGTSLPSTLIANIYNGIIIPDHFQLWIFKSAKGEVIMEIIKT